MPPHAAKFVVTVALLLGEPMAATSVAAAKKLRDTGVIKTDDVVVCNLTGHGLKQPEAIHASEEEFASIVPTLTALREKIRSANDLAGK